MTAENIKISGCLFDGGLPFINSYKHHHCGILSLSDSKFMNYSLQYAIPRFIEDEDYQTRVINFGNECTITKCIFKDILLDDAPECYECRQSYLIFNEKAEKIEITDSEFENIGTTEGIIDIKYERRVRDNSSFLSRIKPRYYSVTEHAELILKNCKGINSDGYAT